MRSSETSPLTGLRAAARHPAVLAAGRSAFVGLGATTSRWRPDPDFLLIGAKRGGSTTLFYGLLDNPHVLPQFPSAGALSRFGGKAADTKGVHWFDRNALRSQAWYRSHFPTQAHRARAAQQLGGPVVTGEGSPYYLFHPNAPGLAAERLPQTKLIVTLRDPVMRTWSHWKEQSRNGVETLDFPAALAAEKGRLIDEERVLRHNLRYRSFAHENQSYASQSQYLPMLERWLEHFPREQLLILVAEHYWSDPQATYDKVADFLGIPRYAVRSPEVMNAAAGASMDEGSRQLLLKRFSPDDAALEALIGAPTRWDRT